MGRRSDMERIPKDKYYTFDQRAYEPVAHIFSKIAKFIEPCAGGGDLILGVEVLGPKCIYACDIEPDDPAWVPDTETDLVILSHGYEDVDSDTIEQADYFITNPPWTRKILHPFIQWCIDSGTPAWLLLDSNWAMTQQARPYLKYCSDIIPTPRLKWIENTKHAAKDDTAWYRFQSEECETVLRNEKPPSALDDLI